MKASLQPKRQHVLKILRRLKKAYPDAHCELIYSTPWELLVATILSAQCTDKRVNMITSNLFKKYRSIDDYAKADPRVFEQEIRSAGFYQNKTRSILGAAQAVLDRFRGNVPDRLEDLITLPGTGRKTANVVLGNAFGIPGLMVDTHMIRINQRLGLTKHKDPVKIELDLMEVVPKKRWTFYSHLIIFHGRRRCFARGPDCLHCEIKDLCPSANKA